MSKGVIIHFQQFTGLVLVFFLNCKAPMFQVLHIILRRTFLSRMPKWFFSALCVRFFDWISIPVWELTNKFEREEEKAKWEKNECKKCDWHFRWRPTHTHAHKTRRYLFSKRMTTTAHPTNNSIWNFLSLFWDFAAAWNDFSHSWTHSIVSQR